MEKPFLRVLTDSSFADFITRRVAKVLYSINIVIAGILGALGVIVGVLSLITSDGLVPVWASIAVTVASPLVALLYLVVVRMSLELSVALIVVAENTRPST